MLKYFIVLDILQNLFARWYHYF